MSREDYVDVNPHQRKKIRAKSYKKNTNTKSNNISIKSFLLIILSLIMMINILIAIFKKDTDNDEYDNIKINDIEEVKLDLNYDSKWNYQDELENSKIEVEVEYLASDINFALQCGAYKSINRARELQALISFIGVESNIYASNGFHLVIIGPFENKRLAEFEKHKLKDADIVGNCIINEWSF